MSHAARRAGAVLLVLCAASAAGVADAQVPLPADDPFYAVPAGIGSLPNGAIIASRPVSVSVLSIPLPVTAWELKYKSLDANGLPTAMVTTVMVPRAPWKGPGARPLVSYQVAEDGAGSQCAISYALHAGLGSLATQSNASTETTLIGLALTKGWAIVASDYEGPDSDFFAAPEEAHGVLDGIRAALAFTPAGLAAGTPIGLWGYSGGGYATSVAAIFQPAYAPELKLTGVAIGSPTEDVRAEIGAFSGSVAGGAVAMGIAALDRAYPEQHLLQYLNAAGRQAVADSAHDCLVQAAARHPFAKVQQWEATPGAIDSPPVAAFLRSISPEYMSGHPAAPVLLYHDATDEFAPIGPALATMAHWCAAGTPVEVHVEPVGEHILYETIGASRAIAYLADRFAGTPAPSTCAPDTGTAKAPARPLRHRRPLHHRRASRTWYVRAAASAPGNGSRRAPFNQLAAVQRASRARDTIVVLRSPASAPVLDGGIALKPHQTLVGAGPPVVGGQGSRPLPRIANTMRGSNSGDAVELARGDTVRNLMIGPAYRGGIYGANVPRVSVTGNDISATNTSCTTGFVVQPFKLPTLVPGVGVPFSGGLPNGWAAIMVDQSRGTAKLLFAGNYVHDAGCADGIDVRASGAAHVAATVTGNLVTRLREGPTQQSVLAIGMQTTGTAALDARLNGNTETYIGSAIIGDLGFADSEGLFANSAGPSRLTEHVDHNSFAHGLGHLSANCFEVVSSSGGPTMNATLTNSSCDHVVGDVLEAVNLSKNATLNFAIDHVRAADSEFIAGPVFHQVEPGDDGICLFELAAGAASTTTVRVSNSVLTGCVTDGLEVASSVDDGTGPVKKLSFDVRHSQITGNTLSNLRVANSSPVTELDGRVEDTNLGGPPATPIILENLDATGGTDARLDFGGGALGSHGGNCLGGGSVLDVALARDSVSARGDWWGRSGGPGPGQVIALGSTVDGGAALSQPPAGTC